jgi:molybdate transport system regulatory protein
MRKATRKPADANASSKKPVIRARLRLTYGPDIAMGPGKADLLDHIRYTGSIAAAGRALGISYKRAWQLVETMNGCFAEPLVTASRGGRGHGNSVLTPTGEAVLASYRGLTKSIEASSELKAIRKLARRGRA